MPKKYLVNLPDNPILSLEEAIQDTNAKVLVTLHTVDGRTVGNIWIKEGNTTERFGQERVTDSKPDPVVLMGVINRAATTNGREIDQDLRFKFAFMGLHLQADKMIKAKVESR